jgi:hypothetical protein
MRTEKELTEREGARQTGLSLCQEKPQDIGYVGVNGGAEAGGRVDADDNNDRDGNVTTDEKEDREYGTEPNALSAGSLDIESQEGGMYFNLGRVFITSNANYMEDNDINTTSMELDVTTGQNTGHYPSGGMYNFSDPSIWVQAPVYQTLRPAEVFQQQSKRTPTLPPAADFYINRRGVTSPSPFGYMNCYMSDNPAEVSSDFQSPFYSPSVNGYQFPATSPLMGMQYPTSLNEGAAVPTLNGPVENVGDFHMFNDGPHIQMSPYEMSSGNPISDPNTAGDFEGSSSQDQRNTDDEAMILADFGTVADNFSQRTFSSTAGREADVDESSVSSLSDSNLDDKELSKPKSNTRPLKSSSTAAPNRVLPLRHNGKASTDIRRHPTTTNSGSLIEFNNPNPNLLPSRNSGYRINRADHYTNKAPKLSYTEEITDASLAKRGLTRSGSKQMSKRASGANDPENITIVNLVENKGWKWPAISAFLNEQRVKSGRHPNFTPNSCHNRYNRNAPLLFAAEGKDWVPIKERSGAIKFKANWNNELDNLLVQCTKEVDSEKWAMVAERFNQRTNLDIDATAAAYRYSLI